VRTLVDEPQKAGTHRVSWDGRDNAGRQVASGVYLYRLEAGDFSKSEKMVLIR
jgi:flagellar hook assembly protein FlgD